MRAPKDSFEIWAVSAGYDITDGDDKDLGRKYKSHATMDAYAGWEGLFEAFLDTAQKFHDYKTNKIQNVMD